MRSFEYILGVSVAAIAIFTGIAAFVRITWRELRRLSRVLDDFSGTPDRPGHAATKGVFERTDDQDKAIATVVQVVDKLSRRQEELAVVATQAAEDVSQVLGELTRNGGDSTKDAAVEAHRVAVEAAELAHKVLKTSEDTNRLLRRHMENGVAIMEVGTENDQAVVEAFQKLGVEVVYRPFPSVDLGEDDFPTTGV